MINVFGNEVIEMSVPVFREFFYPVLEILGDEGIYTKDDIYKKILEKFDFTDEEKSERTRGGTTTKIEDRITWAITYLNHSPLIKKVAWGKNKITKEGLTVFNNENIDSIDEEFLMQYPEFRRFKLGTSYWIFYLNDDDWSFCYDNGLMAVDWNYLGDLNQYDADNFDEEIGSIIKEKENLTENPTSDISSLSAIYKDIQEGDIICVRNDLTTIVAMGKVSSVSTYFYDENFEENSVKCYQLRGGIDWIKLDEDFKLKDNQFSDDILYELDDDKILKVIYPLEKSLFMENREEIMYSRNLIYFGAPGTGKSFTLNENINDLLSGDDCYERVTFHPDYSYANFVGSYKPVSSEEGGISYEYVPGPFMRTLVKAYDKPAKNYLLVIEEINRANVAAVFGDVFQLLDRDKSGSSNYPIETSEDIRKYMKKELGITYSKISIPSNMYIWATMNSADQGVFPMDTAFRRRWDFKYFGIDNDEELIENKYVNLNDKVLSWNRLRKAINEELLSYRINEDKLLGPFFAFDEEYEDDEIPVDEFVDVFKNKILMYLFEDVARSKRNVLFSGVGGKGNLIYSRVCDEFDRKGVDIFCDNIRDVFSEDDG